MTRRCIRKAPIPLATVNVPVGQSLTSLTRRGIAETDSYRLVNKKWRKGDHSERGIYIPLVALSLVAFIAVLGLAVDLGQLYRGKLRIQRAVDAGVFVASRLVGTGQQGQAIAKAQEIAHDNLQAVDTRLGAIAPVANLTGNILAMNGNISLPLLFLNVLPGIPDINTVNGRAAGANQRAIVVLVIDLSQSMAPDFDSHGNYLPNTDKIAPLRSGLITFINDFQENWDYIGIVGFNYNARVLYGVAAPLNKANLIAEINKLGNGPFPYDVQNNPAVGSAYALRPGTNTDHGLRQGLALMKSMQAQPFFADSNKAIVLVTDGSPTASCGDAIHLSTCANKLPAAPASYSTDPRHFDRAILQSDFIRNAVDATSQPLDIAVHAIGLGMRNGGSGSQVPEPLRTAPPLPANAPFLGYGTYELNNPYQNSSDTEGLKSNFLRRVSLTDDPIARIIDKYQSTGLTYTDPTSGLTFAFSPTAYFGSGVPRIATFVSNYQAAHGGLLPPVGEYWFTGNPNLIGVLLSRIGLSVKSRLVR